VWAQGSGNLSQLLIALAAASSGSNFMNLTAVTVSPQTGATAHTYAVTTSSIPITINLPTPTINTWLMVKDVSGNCANNNITLHRAGSELIDGVAADHTMQIPYELCIIASDGTNWFILLEV
jgi:hypothetical protein